MRFFGLGALVMQRMGVSTQLLAGADIYPALERGVIDATEFSMPTIDIDYGFYQIAKNNYYPGWHQQVSCNEYLMNKEKFDALPKAYQAMIRTASTAQVIYTYAETEAANPKAMLEMKEKYGVTNRRWGDDTLATLEGHWIAVLEEKAAEDETWKKIADSYLAWRKLYRIWGDAQALKGSLTSSGPARPALAAAAGAGLAVEDVETGGDDDRAPRDRRRLRQVSEHDESDPDRPDEPHVVERRHPRGVGELERPHDREVGGEPDHPGHSRRRAIPRAWAWSRRRAARG